MNQLLQGNYQNSKLNPLVYRIRQNETAALPFNDLSITNCKSADRIRYNSAWPNWTYTQYSNSFDFAQVGANGNVPNYHGITEFITARRTNALNQLTLSNIGPIISPITITPPLPATNQIIVVSARVEDDVSVSTVRFISRFSGVTTTNNMFDNGIAPDSLAGDKIYTAQLGPYATAGTLTYYIQATDNVNKPTLEPWVGAADTNSLTIGSPFLGLAITELNYHPQEPTGSELLVSTNADDFEFIEFQNLGSTTINLTGVRQSHVGVCRNFQYQHADGKPHQLETYRQCRLFVPNQHAASARRRARSGVVQPSLATNATTLNTFRTHYSIGTNTVLLGAFLGSLSDTGDTLRLQRPDEPPAGEPTFLPMLLEDEVSYSSALPWPTLAAGGGKSLYRRGQTSWGNDPQSWTTGIFC